VQTRTNREIRKLISKYIIE